MRLTLSTIAAFIWFAIGAQIDYTSDVQAAISIIGGTAAAFYIVWFVVGLVLKLRDRKK